MTALDRMLPALDTTLTALVLTALNMTVLQHKIDLYSVDSTRHDLDSVDSTRHDL